MVAKLVSKRFNAIVTIGNYISLHGAHAGRVCSERLFGMSPNHRLSVPDIYLWLRKIMSFPAKSPPGFEYATDVAAELRMTRFSESCIL